MQMNFEFPKFLHFNLWWSKNHRSTLDCVLQLSLSLLWIDVEGPGTAEEGGCHIFKSAFRGFHTEIVFRNVL